MADAQDDEPHVGPAAVPGTQDDEPHVGPAAASYMDEYEKGKAHAKAAQDLLIERGCGCLAGCLAIIVLFLFGLFLILVGTLGA